LSCNQHSDALPAAERAQKLEPYNTLYVDHLLFVKSNPDIDLATKYTLIPVMIDLREYSGVRQVRHDQVDVLSRAIAPLKLANEDDKGEESNLDDEDQRETDEDQWETDEDEKGFSEEHT
jgi:hypothetical protein